MAMSMLPIRPVGVRACAASSDRKPDVNRRGSSSSNWYTPLFGWSAEPDYIDSFENKKSDLSVKEGSTKSEPNQDPKRLARSRYAPGSFTEEKAKQLRMMTTETSTFHDIMYHSAIASRLASDFSNQSDR